ncbi:MAG: Uma2 family endonuclease [Planctomycetes bacterium]|nr:Uma2 family endonuclease [Planctomycetota bacterium]
MSTATLTPPSAVPVVRSPVELLLTAADVAMLPRSLATTDVKYELHDGRLIVMAPPGGIHGRRQAKFSRYLLTEGEEKGHGEAYAEVGILLRRKPDHLVGCDAAFVTKAQLPTQYASEGYLLTIPALVVEVRSKNDTQPEIDAKVQEYLTAGVVLVWVADPDSRTVTAHRTNQPVKVFAASDTLTADGVIPAFAVAVADLLPAT